MRKALPIRRMKLIFSALILCTGFTLSQARGDATATGGPASGPSPSPVSASSPTNSGSSSASSPAPIIDPQFARY